MGGRALSQQPLYQKARGRVMFTHPLGNAPTPTMLHPKWRKRLS